VSNTFVNEVLVLTATPTRLDRPLKRRSGIEIQNLNANPIYVAVLDGNEVASVATICVAKKCRRVAQNETMALALNDSAFVYAISDTADQTTTNGTIVTEVP
jgi:hypothetical protein